MWRPSRFGLMEMDVKDRHTDMPLVLILLTYQVLIPCYSIPHP